MGAAAAVVSVLTTAAASASFSSIALKIGGSLVFSFLSSALSPKPKKPDLSSFTSIKATGVTQQFSQPVTSRSIIYGEARVSGPVLYAGVTNSNAFLHLVIALAGHELEEIGEILIDDQSIAPDQISANGNVNAGRFAGRCRIKKYLGTDAQLADPDLVAEVPEWTDAHRLQGVAYLYVRYTWNRDVFPSGIPNISAWVKGKKILDTRDSTTRWTPNLALCTRDYLVDDTYGFDANESDIDLNNVNSSANLCEEFVTTTDVNINVSSVDATNDRLRLEGDTLYLQNGDRVRYISGDITGVSTGVDYYVIVYQRKTTPRILLAASLDDALAGIAVDITGGSSGIIRKIAEPRYFGGGVIDSETELGSNLKELYTSMAGQVVYAGGVWRILAGQYQTPTVSFGIDDLVGEVSVQTKASKRDRFNRVQGVYISPIFDGNPSDYPAIENTTYQAEDGEVIKTDLDLSFVQRPYTAQRIAKIYMERMRQEIVFTARFKLTAFKVQVGDNILFTFDRYGWTDKVFEVLEWQLGVDDGAPYIEMTCRENASGVYDWNNGEETAFDLAPNTSLPNPFEVSVVGGFSLDSISSLTQGGDRIFNVVASWETPDDQLVVSGGSFEVEYKEVSEMNYKSAGIVDGSATELRLPALQPDTLYDVRIIAFNNIGVSSQPALLEDFLVGSTLTTDTEDWENEALPTEDWEVDTLASEDWEA